MEIENRKTSEIIPYEKNPRINNNAVDKTMMSIKEYGFQQPIVVDKAGIVIAGHTRLKAAIKLNLDTCPVIVADNLSPAQTKAFRIADNKTGELATWDDGLLAVEIQDIIDMGLAIELTGFDAGDFDLDKKPGLTDEDEVPEVKESIAKLGDLWILGEHRLLCGDSTDIEHVERLMDGQKAELLFTSPPYSDMREYNGGKDLSIGNLINFIPVFSEFAEYQVINLGIQRKDHEVVQYWDEYIKKAKSCGYKFLSWNIWNKNDAGSIGNQTAMFAISHEWLLIFGKEHKDLNKTRENGTSGDKAGLNRRMKDGSVQRTTGVGVVASHSQLRTVLDIPVIKGNIGIDHPAMFPVGLPEEHIKAITMGGDIVVEPFCGSGSTLIACEKTNRKCYGMELDEHYCDVIIKRWEDYTGQTAVLRED